MKSILYYLRENAALLEAGATVVLAFITYCYMRLVRKQLEHMKETARVDQQQCASALALFAFHLRDANGKLRDNPIGVSIGTESFFLAESDITELKALARKVNGRAIDLAIQAAMSLRVVYRLIQIDKENAINQRAGSQSTDQEKKTWEKARSDSERALSALQKECGHVAGIDVNSFTRPA